MTTTLILFILSPSAHSGNCLRVKWQQLRWRQQHYPWTHHSMQYGIFHIFHHWFYYLVSEVIPFPSGPWNMSWRYFNFFSPTCSPKNENGTHRVFYVHWRFWFLVFASLYCLHTLVADTTVHNLFSEHDKYNVVGCSTTPYAHFGIAPRISDTR